MELKERIAIILKENHLKQKELAVLMGVTESYVSTLLSGRNRNVSISVANLIEEKLGYNMQWVLVGEEPKYKRLSKNPEMSDIHRQIIMRIEKMSDSEAKAVLAFVKTLDSINKEKSEQLP